LAAAIGEAPSTAVGGKKSDPPGKKRGFGSSDGGSRAAVIGGVVGALALIAIGWIAWMRPTAPTPTPTPIASPSPTPRPTPTPTTGQSAKPAVIEDLRSVEELEHEFLSMRSPLSARDRRAAVRALYARIDAAGGAVDERARKRREALIELIRQHAN
jgi:hypothetical protein